MRARILIGALVVGMVAFAAQDVKLERKYKEGDKDTYKVSMQLTMNGGTANVNLVSTLTVKKVYDNGEADVETVPGDLKIDFNGQTMTQPAPAAHTERFTKQGMPLVEKVKDKNRAQMNVAFMRYAVMLGEKGMRVGETIPVDYTDRLDSANKVKGTLKLESFEKGIAKLVSTCEAWTEDTGAKPMKMVYTIWFDADAGKLSKLVGTVSNVMGPQGLPIDAVQISMERVKL